MFRNGIVDAPTGLALEFISRAFLVFPSFIVQFVS